MKSQFSTFKYQDKRFIFYLIINAKKVIHLTASSSHHEQAIKTIQRYISGSLTTSFPRENSLIDLTKDLIYNQRNPDQNPDFETNPFLAGGTPFQKCIWQLIIKIEYGETKTYKDLAREAGIPGGTRAIGNACHVNPLALIIPCHRVVGVNGPGGYAGGSEIKTKLLEIERKGRSE